MEVNTNVVESSGSVTNNWRLSAEKLLPQNINDLKKIDAGYNIYPSHAMDKGKIFSGYASLAAWVTSQKTVLIDGYVGVFWNDVQQLLQAEFEKMGVSVKWICVGDHMKPADVIQKMVSPYLGEHNSVWGKKAQLDIADFFESKQLEGLQPDELYEINIALGTGAALLNWDAAVVYMELPKSEIQYRMKAGSITNLGSIETGSRSGMYKRFYFVDWAVLNAHKENIVNNITVIADTQWKDSLNWMFNKDLQQGLKQMSGSIFRARPWFAAGAWGGHWMQERIEGLSKEEVNYAWSFELIVPENGIVFESDGNLLEVSFDFLMFKESESVLGKHAAVFGTEFPIRFDFLDTFDGGNLSIQCHPSRSYIHEKFGENITQDETYYILDCKNDAKVYLGFQENIDPEKFKKELIGSQEMSKEIDIEKYVQVFNADKHDFFLIPNGTVHSAGKDNLVLEISATPYIFTFKMYDWMRMDLDGHPRPINIDHAFNNLKFERKGERVREELISKPSVIEEGKDWKLIHLPTHKDHFYDVHRMEFDTQVTIETNNVCHILMLVEGTTVKVETADGTHADFYYAETFVVPAAAKRYTIINTGETRAKVVKAFVKDDINLTAK